jgi:hypothetical protein
LNCPLRRRMTLGKTFELLGYAPQCLSHDLRLNSLKIIKVSVYCLPPGE